MKNDEADIRGMLDELFESFQTLDPRAMVRYYHLPSMAISAQGASVMSTAADVEARFARLMQRLKNQDYARSDYSEARVTMLGETLAQLRVTGARYRRDGNLLEPLNVSYVLRKTDAGWKVVVLMTHDPGAAPSTLVK
jgi:hypothetical protein